MWTEVARQLISARGRDGAAVGGAAENFHVASVAPISVALNGEGFMAAKKSDLPDWEELLGSMCRLQKILPDAVLVGGSAAAIHAKHRFSRDHDHVLPDLSEHFAEVLQHLEDAAGWRTARVRTPVMILGSLDGIETGVRQLIRKAPLETMTWPYRGQALTVPTPEETLRIKAWLALRRNATRDYLDAAALADCIGDNRAAAALMKMDELYPQENGDWSVRTQIVKQFAEPKPYDLDEVDLREYKAVQPPYDSWTYVAKRCRELSAMLTSAFERSIADQGGTGQEIE